MNNGKRIFIQHENNIISYAESAMTIVKKFHTENQEVRDDIDEVCDYLARIEAACQTFLNIVENSNADNI